MELIVLFLEISGGKPQNYNTKCIATIDTRDELSAYFGGESKNNNGVFLKHLDRKFVIPENTLKGLYCSARDVISFVDNIFQLDEKYKSSNSTINL
ncbi:hypothetical protein KW842_00955 [Duganella sp. sic0402]|uniref:hypothetical protein n=1 Tax=Duganella sp. sic0402 TaxID=2854786 RepID=UPI001C476073|nr:hypothetical protein [Duganella sp. sic0402]MBV7534322.1 hypothetical protein [Duganella sp. sic0402]